MATPTESSMAAEDYDDGEEFYDARSTNEDMEDTQPRLTTVSIDQQCHEAFFPQGISELTIYSQTTQCVKTPDFEEAEELLQDVGHVVLCGPPGCGKTTLALALLRRSREKGFKPHIISKLEKLDNANTETSVASEPTVLLLDGTLGTVCVDSHQHGLWKEKRPGLMELVDQGRCRLIITLYPHVQREVMALEGGAYSPMSNRSLIVQVGGTLDTDIKKQMLDFHLKKLQLDQSEYSEVVQTILRTDRSGPGFPWCCHHLVKYWSTSTDPAIFSAPEETHALLFDKMVTHPIHGRLFAAVLALTMRGFHDFLHRPGQAQPELTRLGLDAFSDDQLAEYADVLRDSILTEDGKNFARRVLYDAAALALGRSFRLPTMLKACDLTFLVQHVWVKPLAAHVSRGAEPKLCIIVGLFACTSASRPVRTTLEDLRSLLDRVYGEMTSGHLPEISQHPSLQCSEFLKSLKKYCQAHSHSVQRLIHVVDPVHGLPLVYWSVFNQSDTLTQWCLTHMTQTQSGRRLLSPPVLLACAVFDQLAGNSSCRLQSLLKGVLKPKHFSYKTRMVELPLLERGQCLTQDSLQYLDLILGSESDEKDLYYLCEPSLPIPAETVEIQVSGKVIVQVHCREDWYLVHRLLSDRKVDVRDGEGNTLLHLAAKTWDHDIVELAVKSGCSLLTKNRQRKTSYQVAQRRLSQLKLPPRLNDGLSGALRDGDQVKAKTLLHSVSVHRRDNDGSTGLHIACENGQRDLAELLTQLGAKVNAKNWHGFTPLHLACLHGQPRTAELLVQQGARVNKQSRSGKTALHYACLCSSQAASVEISRCLLASGADVHTRDEDGGTPLDDAVKQGNRDTACALVTHEANNHCAGCIQ